MNDEQAGGSGAKIDISVIRPGVGLGDVKLRGEGMDAARLKKIKKGLHTLHTLELMAQNIYRFQITGERSELNRQLIAAMCNEMTHLQDFQIKLYEYGWKPQKMRWMYWIVGFVIGFGSRLLGTKAKLKAGIWVESKAVVHYGELLEMIEWDEDSRRVVEKDQADESGHISRWRKLLEEM